MVKKNRKLRFTGDSIPKLRIPNFRVEASFNSFLENGFEIERMIYFLIKRRKKRISLKHL